MGLIIVPSCTHIENEEALININNTAKTNAIDITPIRMLNGDAFPFSRKFYIHRDSILVIFNRSENTTGASNIPFFEFRNVCDTTLIKQIIHRGNGPNEMLLIQCEYQDTSLYIMDIMKNNFTILNIDSILSTEKIVFKTNKSGFSFGNYKRYLNSYIFDNYNYFFDKTIKVKQNAQRFIVGDGSKGDPHHYKYNAFNVNQGKILVNPRKGRVFYFNHNNPMIEIYDYNLKLIKKIKGPDESLARYRITNDKNIVFYGKIPWYYCNYIYNDESIFITYNGVLIHGDTNRTPALIFEFDWDGNFIASYNPHEPVVTLSIGEKDNRVLYITSTDSLGQPVLDKLILPSL